MQKRVLLLIVILTATTLSYGYAKKEQATNANKKVTDTTAKTMLVPTTGTDKVAANMLGTAVPGVYNHVPLAGEKSYFGDMNEYVNDFTRKYMEMHFGTLNSVQNNSEKPFSVIDNILEEKKMPKELKYLAVIESALNHKAVSHAGAVGPWQMMETTARMMGLSVSKKIDERTDWIKSTTAATKYLDYLYSQLNDWLLVVAAYNSGPTPVQRAIEKTGSRNFWTIKEYLPRETQGHVLAFIATASIFENLSKFISLGSIPVDFKFSKEKEEEYVAPPAAPVTMPAKTAVPSTTTTTAPPATTIVVAPKAVAPVASTVVVNAEAPKAIAIKKVSFTDDELKNMVIVRLDQPISFEVIAQELGVDKKLLNRWNPDYELFEAHNYVTPYFKLRFPKDKSDAFILRKEAFTKKSVAFYNQGK